MKFLLRIFRILLLFIWSILLMIPAAITHLTPRLWSRCRLGTFWAQFWSRGAAKIMNIRIRPFGSIPAGSGKMIISNHLGPFDVLAHASHFRIRFAPKKEIRSYPVFGWLTALNAPVWIDRKRPKESAHYAEMFRATMDHGINMLVYPEGTSSDGKHGLKDFKSTPFASVLEAGVTILPTLLFYREYPPESGPGAWFGEESFGHYIWRVLAIPRMEIDLRVLPEITPLPGEDRKMLAARCHEIMEKEYWQIEH